MQYQIEVEELSNIRRRFAFTVPANTVKAEVDVEYIGLARKARLPGFRPGKVPQTVLAKKYGAQVHAEVGERIVNQVWREAITTIDVAGSPSLVDRGDVKPGEAFSFSIEVDVRPTVSLNEYKGIDVPYNVRTVDEADVDRLVDVKLASLRRLSDIEEDRAVELGDQVLTALVLKAGDEVVADETGTRVNTRGDRFYPGVEGELVGMKKGESKEVDVTIAESSVLDGIRGKAVSATLRVEAIQAYVTPALTDDVAAELKYEGGVDGMRLAIREELQASADASAREAAQVALVRHLVNSHEFDVPEMMVAEQYEALVEEHKIRRAYAGEDMRTIVIDPATAADLRNRAVFAAKASLILVEVSRAEGIDTTPEDLSAKIEEIAAQRGQTASAIRAYLEREQAMPILEIRVREEKVLAWLMENANLVAPAAEEAASEEASATEEAPVAEEAAAE